MNFLKVILGILLKVLGQSVLNSLLELVLHIGTHIAYLHLHTLTNLVALLGEFATALLGGHWNTKTDNLAIVLGCDTHIRIHNGLLDCLNLLFVPRTNGYRTRVGS